jgi:adenosylcobinamide kinase / adenosylcobinamide-phosphate guanylyltransferase
MAQGQTILIVGGARSGKSRLAQRLAAGRAPVTYLATATVDPADAEMAARIARHRAERPEGWTTLEVPRDLPGALGALVAQEGSVVIDCATLWISNLMLGIGGGPACDDAAVLAAVDAAAQAAKGRAQVIWVSNEVGLGGVPAHPVARRFADLQGLANQKLAAACDSVYFCAAGLSIQLK